MEKSAKRYFGKNETLFCGAERMAEKEFPKGIRKEPGRNPSRSREAIRPGISQESGGKIGLKSAWV